MKNGTVTVQQLLIFLRHLPGDKLVRFVDHNNEEMNVDEMYVESSAKEPTITFFAVDSK